MRAFWANAEDIFETARQAGRSGEPDCDWAILIGPQGHIQMLEASGWALSSLLEQNGARTAYRITRERGSVRLEGRSGSQTCVLYSDATAETARHLLADAPACAIQRRGARLLPEGITAQPTKAQTWAISA